MRVEKGYGQRTSAFWMEQHLRRGLTTPEKKTLPCKWVYKAKQHNDGNTKRLKAKLVIKKDK